jgi:hypothetical protein
MVESPPRYTTGSANAPTSGVTVIEWKLGLLPLNSNVSLLSQLGMPYSRGFRRTLLGVPSGFLNSATRTFTSKDFVTLPFAFTEIFSNCNRRTSART